MLGCWAAPVGVILLCINAAQQEEEWSMSFDCNSMVFASKLGAGNFGCPFLQQSRCLGLPDVVCCHSLPLLFAVRS